MGNFKYVDTRNEVHQRVARVIVSSTRTLMHSVWNALKFTDKQQHAAPHTMHIVMHTMHIMHTKHIMHTMHMLCTVLVFEVHCTVLVNLSM